MKKTNVKHKLWRRITSAASRLKDSDWALLLATVHSLISIPISNNFFIDPGDDEILKRNKLLINILFFFVMFFVYWGLIFLFRHHKKYHNYIKFGLLYFFLLMVILALVWPGVWRGPNDEFIIALNAQEYAFYGWQHSLTSIFFMLSYKIMPIFSGAIITQCVIIAAISSYLYNNLTKILKLKNKLSKIILLIPFILPPVLDNALYPIRAVLYSYIIILLIFLMIKTITEQKQVPLLRIIALTVLCILACTWRGEGIYYSAVVFIFLAYLITKRFSTIRTAIVSVSAIIIGMLAINAFQNSTLTVYLQQGYKIASTTKLLVPLVEEASLDDSNRDTLTNIDKIISVQDILDQKYEQAQDYYFGDSRREDFTEKDYNEYMKSFIALCLKYPKNAILHSLYDFTLAISSSTVLNDTTLYFDEDRFSEVIKEELEPSANSSTSTKNNNPSDEVAYFYENASNFMKKGGATVQPWNNDLRSFTIKLLEGREINNYSQDNLFGVFSWNIAVPILSILSFCIFTLIKRHLAISLIIGSILIKTIIVMLTSPLPLHMYYYSEYLLGYIILFALLAYVARNLHLKHRQGKTKSLPPASRKTHT